MSNVFCYPAANGSATSSTDSGSGPLNAKFTWQPASAGEPAPSAVIVQENCNVTMGWSYSGGATLTGSDSTGFGQGGTISGSTGSNVTIAGTNYSGASGGSSVSAPACSPSVSQSGSSSMSGGTQAGFTITYNATATPVTIGLVGATLDSKGGLDVLVGMDVSPFLVGIPASCTISNYQWTVTGTTMQSWKVSSDSTRTTEVDGSGPLNTAEARWFWNDSQQATETITCTATVTPPNGQGAPFPITATQDVGVYLPVLTAKALGGQMTVDANEPGSKNSADFWLHAAPSVGSSQPGGMTWQVDLTPPQNAPVAFEQGNIYLVQTITPDVKFINSANQEYEDIFQGQLGVDTRWPYGWATYQDPPYEPDYVAYDSPGIDLTALNAIYGAEESSFEDYIMYQPYGSSEYVPLANFKWNINGTVTIPSTNNWADYQNPAGIIEPSGTPALFTRDNSYPSWTQNSGNVPDNALAFKPF